MNTKRKPDRVTTRADGKRYEKVRAGYVGPTKMQDPKLKFMEQSVRLLRTLSDPKTKSAVRIAVGKKLAEIIPKRESYLKEKIGELLKLQKNRPLELEEKYDLMIKRKGLAEVELVRALSEGEESTSKRVEKLTARVLELRKEVGRMRRKMER